MGAFRCRATQALYNAVAMHSVLPSGPLFVTLTYCVQMTKHVIYYFSFRTEGGIGLGWVSLI